MRSYENSERVWICSGHVPAGVEASPVEAALFLQAKRKGLSGYGVLTEGVKKIMSEPETSWNQKLGQCRSLFMDCSVDLVDGFEAGTRHLTFACLLCYFLCFLIVVFFFLFIVFFPKASPMLGFSFSLLEGGVERGLTGPWCGRDV